MGCAPLRKEELSKEGIKGGGWNDVRVSRAEISRAESSRLGQDLEEDGKGSGYFQGIAGTPGRWERPSPGEQQAEERDPLRATLEGAS